VRNATLENAVVTTLTSGGGGAELALEVPPGAEGVLLAGQAHKRLVKQAVNPSLLMKAYRAIERGDRFLASMQKLSFNSSRD
jgi:hypothetical protein